MPPRLQKSENKGRQVCSQKLYHKTISNPYCKEIFHFVQKDSSDNLTSKLEADFRKPIHQLLHNFCRPYLRYFSLNWTNGIEKVSYLCYSPLQSYFLANSQEIAIDATYKEFNTLDKYYLINIAVYSEDLEVPETQYESQEVLFPRVQNLMAQDIDLMEKLKKSMEMHSHMLFKLLLKIFLDIKSQTINA